MRTLLPLAVLLLSGIMLVGCSDTPAPNAAGAEANTGKTYTAEDANAAQPNRGEQGSK